MAKDPICGMYVEESPESLHSSQRGTTFYFCSAACFQAFIAPARELARLRRLTVLSFVLGIPVLILTWTSVLPAPFPRNLVLFALATPVQFVAGGMFYKGAWHSIRARAANMDVLIALGTTAAWLYSSFATLSPGLLPEAIYFDVSSLIIGFILLGRLLEYQMRAKATDSARKLLDLRPKSAIVLKDGAESVVRIEEVQVGDLVRVRPGDEVPTDGVIVEGHSTIDEKMLTGESVPVERKEGDEVIGATTNQTGLLTIRATKVGSDTTLSQIVKLVEDAQAAQAPIQRLADRVAAYFVPIVISVAAVSLVTWYLAGGDFLRGLTAFIAVLIIACPCALGLATPAAVVVGTGKGVANGILIRGGENIESASRVTVVVLDKTGTITVGEPSVTDVASLGNLSEEELLGLAASAEFGSEHPVGRAMVKGARALKLRVERPTEFEAVPGMGIKATVGKRRILVGSRSLLEEERVDLGHSEDVISELENKGRTTMLVAVDRQVGGVVAVSDKVKPGAREAVESLKSYGLNVVMLTGDNVKTAKAVASEVGVGEVLAGVLPSEKAAAIKELKGEGQRVAMVGDGINDAPALAQADVGIAIGSGTDVAIETAGIVLMRDDLRDVVGAVRLSRATMRKIKQNLIWAFAYNTILIPVAATGYLNPILAGIAMALSSVSVVMNSLSLNRLNLNRQRSTKSSHTNALRRVSKTSRA